MGPNYKRVTTNVLQEMKNKGEKISMLTAYDYTLAKIVDNAGVDVILIKEIIRERIIRVVVQNIQKDIVLIESILVIVKIHLIIILYGLYMNK